MRKDNLNTTNKLIKAKRIEQLMDLLTQGKHKWEITNQLTKEWDCSSRNVERYLTICYKLIAESYDKNTMDNIVAKYDFLYKRALERGDDRLALRVLDSISRVKGLYSETNTLNINIEQPLFNIEPKIIEIPNNNKNEDEGIL